MPLTLKDAVFMVRSRIGELNQFYWSDYQIIRDLNTGARQMCSIAGALTRFDKLLLELDGNTGSQEAALDVEVDEVKDCKYFSGQLYDLEYHEWQSLQTGASTGSIPRYFYLKTETRQLTPQSTATSDIIAQNIGPNGPLGEVYRTVLGVWPIPPNPAYIEVWYSYFHNYMQDPTDPCSIPSRFLRGWAAYAIAECLRNEKAFSEADYYQQIFDKYSEDYRVYAAKQKNGSKPARYGLVESPWRQNASSSVILVDPMPLGP